MWRKAWKEGLRSHLEQVLSEPNEETQTGEAFALAVMRIYSVGPRGLVLLPVVQCNSHTPVTWEVSS